MKGLVLLWVCCVGMLQVQAADMSVLSAKVVDVDSPDTLLFSWSAQVSNTASLATETTFFNPDNTINVSEYITLSDDKKSVVQYRYVRKNVDESASVRDMGEELIFERDYKGERKRRTQKKLSPFISGPQTVTYIRNHFGALLEGEKRVIHYAVLDRLKTFPFVLKLKSKSPDKVVISMFPKNVIVRQFVSPIYFTTNGDGTQILEITGRILPVVPTEKELLPIDARMVFQ